MKTVLITITNQEKTEDLATTTISFKLILALVMIVHGFAIDLNAGSPHPDLVVGSISIEQELINAGDSLDLMFDIQNTGAGEAGGFWVYIFLSRDTTYDLEDYGLGWVYMYDLPGDSVSEPQMTTLTTPESGHPIYSGSETYNIGIYADGSLEIAETNESNNIGYTYVSIEVDEEPHNQYDLLASYFNVLETSLSAGDSLKVEYTIQNLGPSDSDVFWVDFYLSVSSTPTPLDLLLCVENVTVLSNSDTGILNTTFQLPDSSDLWWSDWGLGDSTYYVHIIIDSYNEIDETNEDNNYSYDDVWISGLSAELSGMFISAPDQLNAGDSFEIQFEIDNGQSGYATFFSSEFYLSYDSTFDALDYYLISHITDSLTGNSTTGPFSVQMTLPDNSDYFWAGNQNYFIVAVIDSGDFVAESNEDNNTASVDVSITIEDANGNDPVKDYVEGEVIYALTVPATEELLNEICSMVQATSNEVLWPGEIFMLTLKEGADTLEALGILNSDPRVEYAELNGYYYPIQTVPNDPHYLSQWAFPIINAPDAWDNATNASNVLVAVIDTGVQWDHPDLVVNMWTNPGEIAGNGLDDDGNGLVDDIHGYDFVDDDGNPYDIDGHGTHVAGIIGAVTNNGLGVAGVCWRTRIVAIRGIGPWDAVIRSIFYAAVTVNAQISNNSYGGGFSQGVRDAIDMAGNRGHLFIAAAGNAAEDNDINPHFPASYDLPEIISVAATDNQDQIASFSNWGRNSVDLGAPGVDIWSTWIGSTYNPSSGTSMAAPHVAGAATLLYSVSGETGHQNVKRWIMDSVDLEASLTNRCVTNGRLNLQRSFDLMLSCDNVLFDNGNINAVLNNPPFVTLFTLVGPARITEIRTYHWNNGSGAAPGTISLLDLMTGQTYGPWQTVGTGYPVQNADWTASMDVELCAGTYQVIDSNPSSWSYNFESGNAGITQVKGCNLSSRIVFDNSNGFGVQNDPPIQTIVSFVNPVHILSIRTYHWNNGNGASPGTISLVHIASGQTYGPWQAIGTGSIAQNTDWTVTPCTIVPAGNYFVIDSDPATWSHNLTSGYQGFTSITVAD